MLTNKIWKPNSRLNPSDVMVASVDAFHARAHSNVSEIDRALSLICYARMWPLTVILP